MRFQDDHCLDSAPNVGSFVKVLTFLSTSDKKKYEKTNFILSGHPSSQGTIKISGCSEYTHRSQTITKHREKKKPASKSEDLRDREY